MNVNEMINSFYDESVLYVLYGKCYFYKTLDIIRDMYENDIRSNSLNIRNYMDKRLIDTYKSAYKAVKSLRSKFCNTFGTGKTSIETLERKGILREEYDYDGIKSVRGNIDKLVKYLSDVDLEFKFSTEKRIKRFSIMNGIMAQRYDDDDDAFYSCDMWEIFFMQAFENYEMYADNESVIKKIGFIQNFCDMMEDVFYDYEEVKRQYPV